MIAVCGASGTIGRRVVAALKTHGAKVRALMRSPLAEHEQHVESVPADLSKPESLAAAFEGIESVFLLSPNGPRQFDMELNVVRAAAATNVKRIVKLSVMGAAADSSIEFARLHGRVEDAVRACGCEWSFVRPNMFMQNLFWYKSALQSGILPLPLADAAVSHVDAEDVAAAAAQALLDDHRAGRIYTITGPQALTGGEVASALSTILEKTMAYQPVTLPAFRAFLTRAGESDYVADAEVELFSYWSEGHGSEVTGDVLALLGRNATPLEEFVKREKAQLI